MHKQFYYLAPVEVVKVTAQNLDEVAEWCGGKVLETDSRRVEGRKDKYVWVPTPKGSTISWAFPGMFITRRVVQTSGTTEARETWAVYRRDYFEKNYYESAEAATASLETAPKKSNKKKAEPVNQITVNIYGTDNFTEVAEKVKEALGDIPNEVVAGVSESGLGKTDEL